MFGTLAKAVFGNYKTSLMGAASVALYFVFPLWWPKYNSVWQGLAAIAVGAGLLASRDAATGSDSVGGPIDNHQFTQGR